MRTKTENKIELQRLMDELMNMSMHDERFVDTCSARAAVLLKIYTEDFRYEHNGLGAAMFTGNEYKPEGLANGFKSGY